MHEPPLATPASAPLTRESMGDEGFGEWLAEQLRLRDLTQRGFAERAGVRHPAVAAWLSNFSVPEWHTCRKIADALMVPRDEVRRRAGYLDEDEEPRPSAEQDDWLTALVSVAVELEEQGIDREALLRTALALRDYSRRRR